MNDFSRLNSTLVHEVIRPTTEEQIRDAIQEAAAKGLKVAIAGKRHSMGGQTLYPDAIALDMLAFNRIVSLNDASKNTTVQSGATWSDIQRFFNPRGLAVFSMQGPNVFTVGGSMSVNAHGWDMRHGPVASSIDWFRILLADGSIRRCSREENEELFHLVLGGYGFFGVILDVGLRVTQNFGYVADVAEMDFSQLPELRKQIRSSVNVELGEADLLSRLAPYCAMPWQFFTQNRKDRQGSQIHWWKNSTSVEIDISSICRVNPVGERLCDGLCKRSSNIPLRAQCVRGTTSFVRQSSEFNTTAPTILTSLKSTLSHRKTSSSS